MPIIPSHQWQQMYQLLLEKYRALEAENEALWEEVLELRDDLLTEELVQFLDHNLKGREELVLPVTPISLHRH